jgi:hypothetical protein
MSAASIAGADEHFDVLIAGAAISGIGATALFAQGAAGRRRGYFGRGDC